MKKLVVLFIAMTVLATFTLSGCNRNPNPPTEKGATGETGAPGTPTPAPSPEEGAPGAPGTPVPPPIPFAAPPDLIGLPETSGVYVDPNIDADMYFYNGWWWRLWEGRWYRSHYYDRGWGYYNDVPSFYYDVDPGWRGYYRDHNWNGHRWNYERIPYQRFQENWRSWQTNRSYGGQKTWGIQGYQARSQREMQGLRQQRQQQYQQRPEVQKHQQYVQQQKQVQKPQVQQKEQLQKQVQKPQVQQKERPQKQVQKPQVQQKEQPQRSQAKPERGEEEHRK